MKLGTSIILDFDGDTGVAEGRADVAWCRRVNWDDLVGGGIVGGAGGDAEEVFVCHLEL